MDKFYNFFECLSNCNINLNVFAEKLNGDIDIPYYRIFYIKSALAKLENQKNDTLNLIEAAIKNKFHNTNLKFKLPNSIKTKLREYQEDGVKWLYVLYQNNFGGILADDMGLGKTLQFLTFMETVKKENVKRNCLIVCPSSLMFNWENEIKKFIENPTVQIISGNSKCRKYKIEMSDQFTYNIVSYDLLKRDIHFYKDTKFDVEIIDEAQYIKNPKTLIATCVKMINSKHRFALSGTPIENRLTDLWSIFDFVMPNYLFSFEKFKENFDESEQDDIDLLKSITLPFIKRRKKFDVLDSLPECSENIMLINMTKEQSKVYDIYAKDLFLDLCLNTNNLNKRKFEIFSKITKLRMISCAPEICCDNYNGGSGKIDACLELLKNVIENGHRVVVFSQFTSLLELIQSKWKNISEENFGYLSGTTFISKRKKIIEDFQSDQFKIFFISLKAGGVGLNLTNADTVIHLDPWWNFSVQKQATDRVYRIGQNKKVNVIKLISKDTIEEKILEIQEKKLNLAKEIFSNETLLEFNFDNDDIQNIFEMYKQKYSEIESNN